MAPLSHLELFSNMSARSLELAERFTTVRHYDAEEVVLAQGEGGTGLYVVQAGTLYLKPHKPGKAPTVFLGPGEAFGELSLLSASGVSASVLASSSADVYLVPAEVFHQLFAEEPAFRHKVAQLLVRRLRLRTSLRNCTPLCVFVALPATYPTRLPTALLSTLRRYVGVFPQSRVIHGRSDISVARSEIAVWRAANSEDAFILFVSHGELLEFRDSMRAGDGVLIVESHDRSNELCAQLRESNADIAVLRIGDAIERAARADEIWSHIITSKDLDATCDKTSSAAFATEIDRIARWMTRRSIGLALGAGAARGFAHLGVLEALETSGVPIDFVVGSSIGGIVALLYGLSASARGAREMARSTIGATKLIRDVSWLPLTAVFAGRKVRRSADQLTSGMMIRDLKRPASAVSTDLISGKRFIWDRGPVATALVATSAIPGIFPPVKEGERVLVDGALSSLVPVDLLTAKRCGLKIAVNVQPDVISDKITNDNLERSLGSRINIVSLIARSWDLLGCAHGASECEGADIILRPDVGGISGYDFDSFEHFVAQGKMCALGSLDLIKDEAARLLNQRS